jgi:hypothetical protein
MEHATGRTTALKELAKEEPARAPECYASGKSQVFNAQERPRNELATIPPAIMERWIYLIREQKVMLDRNLAELYAVETRPCVS